MNYEYTDPTGFILKVWGANDNTYITSQRRKQDEPFGVYLPNHDAPAVALAILEAAGIGTGDYEPGEIRDPDHVAVDALRQWKEEQEAKAARDVEDTKVRAFIAASTGGPVDKSYRITDYDRAEYKRVREFFQEDK